MKKTDESLQILNKYSVNFPATVMVLGSGWNKILEKVDVKQEIGYAELFGVETSVPGHEGKLVIGSVNGKTAAFMSGRFHTYEGYSAEETTAPVRLFAKAGMKNLVLTAACGALNEKFKVGDFTILSDVITLFLALDSPLKGPQFVDVSEVFSPQLRQKAIATAVKNNIDFHEGTYVYYHGPNYETPADKMALRFLGADVVGMSMVPETLVARSLGINTIGLAFVTNLAFVKHDHKEVVAQANKASGQMVKILESLIIP